MNLPNKLTVLRLILVPAIVIVMMVSDDLWADIVAIVLFTGASITDLLDGRIARRDGLITDFGKLLDPLADKFMVIGTCMMILYRAMLSGNRIFAVLFFWNTLILVFRELAVTSMRLMVAGSKKQPTGEKKDLAANMLGKTKTCVQIGCVLACLAEHMFYTNIPPLNFLLTWLPLSYLSTAGMILFTVWSGIVYIIGYSKYLDSAK